MRATCLAHIILTDMILLIIPSEEQKLLRSSLCYFPPVCDTHINIQSFYYYPPILIQAFLVGTLQVVTAQKYYVYFFFTNVRYGLSLQQSS
jgi:hypothetical protein